MTWQGEAWPQREWAWIEEWVVWTWCAEDAAWERWIKRGEMWLLQVKEP